MQSASTLSPIIQIGLAAPASHSCWKPNQDDAGNLTSTRICEQTEVLVFSQQDSYLRRGQRQDDIVLNSRTDFSQITAPTGRAAAGSDRGTRAPQTER